jgi:hypothetical protein
MSALIDVFPMILRLFAFCLALRVCDLRANLLYCHSEKRMVHKEHIVCFTIVEWIWQTPVCIHGVPSQKFPQFREQPFDWESFPMSNLVTARLEQHQTINAKMWS